MVCPTFTLIWHFIQACVADLYTSSQKVLSKHYQAAAHFPLHIRKSSSLPQGKFFSKPSAFQFVFALIWHLCYFPLEYLSSFWTRVSVETNLSRIESKRRHYWFKESTSQTVQIHWGVNLPRSYCCSAILNQSHILTSDFLDFQVHFLLFY